MAYSGGKVPKQQKPQHRACVRSKLKHPAPPNQHFYTTYIDVLHVLITFCRIPSFCDDATVPTVTFAQQRARYDRKLKHLLPNF